MSTRRPSKQKAKERLPEIPHKQLNSVEQKFLRGLDGRAQLAEMLLYERPAAHGQPVRRERRITQSRGGNGEPSEFQFVDGNRRLLLSAVLASPFIPTQMSTVETIAVPGELRFNRCYAIGAALSQEGCDLQELTDLNEVDQSVALESMLRFKAIAGFRGPMRQRLLDRADAYASGLAKNGRSPAGNIAAQLAFPSDSGTRKNHEASIRAYLDRVTQYKREWLPIHGPDLYSILQALCDPAMRLDPRCLSSVLRLVRHWGLDQTFVNLLTLRLLGPYDGEKTFIRENLDTLIRPFRTKSENRMVEQIIGVTPFTKLTKPRNVSYSAMQLWHFFRLARGLENAEAQSVIDSLIDLYVLDPWLIKFLDWEAIYAVVGDNKNVDARSTFVTFLMDDDTVRTLYPYVAMATGKGALIGDFTSLIDRRRRTDAISLLFSRIRKLPTPASKALANALLQRPIIERLASALPLPIISKHPRSVEGLRVSMVRLAALRAADESGLVPSSHSYLEMDAEIKNIRMHYFQERMRSGLVRVSAEDIERMVAEMAASGMPALGLLRSMPEEETRSSGLADRLIQFIADRITDAILYESNVNFDLTLSNCLRHGVVVPRFLLSFDDALQTTLGARSISVWNEEHVNISFPDDGKQLLKLWDRVSDIVRTFVSDWLEIRPGSGLDETVRNSVANLLSGYAKQPAASKKGPSLEALIAECAIRELGEHLKSSGNYLATTVRDSIVGQINFVRSEACLSSYSDVAGFLDCLESNTAQAVEEVRQWLQIADAQGNTVPFQLDEVVKIHLLSTSLSAVDKLRVRTSCHERVGDSLSTRQVLIKGKHLDFFQEVVRNLLSNAFKHSGEGLKTSVQLDFLAYEEGFRIRCASGISKDRIGAIARDYAEIVALANSESPEQARRDQMSGFQKIRRAFQNSFGKQPQLEISQAQILRGTFQIELSVNGIESPLAR